jgi:glycosyltransferase involved in cell wall biosynthesis
MNWLFPGQISSKLRAEYIEYLGNVAGISEIIFGRFGCFFFSQKFLQEAERLSRTAKFDVIFADKANASIYGYLLSKKFGLPWIYSSHNVEYRKHFDFARNDYKRYPYSAFMYLTERIGCTADLFVAISEEDANVFRRWVTNDKLLVIPQGFNEQTFSPAHEKTRVDSRPIILFFGNLEHVPNKEATYLIVRKIVPQVIKVFPDALFQIVGANPPTDLKHPNVEFTGFVHDIVRYIRDSTIVIIPILLGGGVRTKIIESLACGKVIVSTPKGAEGMPGLHYNLIIKEIEEFPDAICKQIQMLMSGETSPFDFGTIKDHFSWDSILQELRTRIETTVKK